MIITIGSDIICDGADRSQDKNSGPSNYRMSGDVTEQIAEFLRADDVTVYNRKNRKAQVSFDVKRLCASVDAAETYCNMHPWTVTRSGTLTITTTGGSLRILTATLKTVSCTFTGATVFVSYLIIGGKVEPIT